MESQSILATRNNYNSKHRIGPKTGSLQTWPMGHILPAAFVSNTKFPVQWPEHSQIG